jgi:hypothetical protein
MIFDTDILIQAAQGASISSMSIQEYVKECISYEKHEHVIQNSKQNMFERKAYAEQIFRFTVIWCFGLFVLLFGCGLGNLKLSDTVITAFIGSTTMNVFIFFKLVTEYLFNKDKPHD